jgi:hypothetical protein
MGLLSYVRGRKPVTASRASESGTAGIDDWEKKSTTVYNTPLTDSEQMAKGAAQTGAEMARRSEWDKTPEGKAHNSAEAWNARDKDSKYVSGGTGGGMRSQSSNIANQRG